MEERIIGLVKFLRGEISVCSQRPLDEAERTVLNKWRETASAAYRLVPDPRFLDLMLEIDELLAPQPESPNTWIRLQPENSSNRSFPSWQSAVLA